MRRFAIGVSLLLLASCTATTSSGTVTITAPGTASLAPPMSSSTGNPPSAATGNTSSAATRNTVASSSRPTAAPARTSTPTSATKITKPTPVPTGSCAARILAGMTDEQRAGQLVMAAVPADDIGAGMQALGSLPVGGVFLAGRSIAPAKTLAADLAAAQQVASRTAGAPLQVAVDQEGGYVQNLRGPDFPPIPTAVEQGQESTDTLAEDTGAWSAELVKAGITLDLAPVADVVPEGTASENAPIGAQDRQYGSTPEEVSESVVTVVRAMLGAKLGTTVKHFPGLGRVRANTDTSADAVDDRTTAKDEALQPFQDAINAHTTAVMVSSASYPNLDPDHVAAFSEPIITGLLRGTMHFKGLVISDDLGAAVAVSDVPVGQRAVEFVQAGGDMALTVQPTDAGMMVDALAAKARASAAFRSRVTEAAVHVLDSKQALAILPCS